jgi:FkbM family methyltransferase
MQILKSLIPTQLKTFLKKKRDYNAIDNLDKKLKQFLYYKNGFYIECGANDGINQSNTWYFEKKLNWRGVLIEPVPNLFKKLTKNRNKKNIFINKCLVRKDFYSKKINMNYDNCMTKVSNAKNKKISVETSTLSKILCDKKIPKIIDLFSLDVEGYEFEVLAGINYKHHKFKYILVETKKFFKLNNFLLKKKYFFVKKLSRHDYLFKRK